MIRQCFLGNFIQLGLFSLFGLGCFNTVLLEPVAFQRNQNQLQPVVLYEENDLDCFFCPSAQRVLLLSISGVITSNGMGTPNQTTPAAIKRILDQTRRGDSIRAILLKIDSPGGEVGASDQIYRIIQDYARKFDVPVYSHIEGLGASGGYYIAMASSHINAHPTAMTGSIGVIMRSFGMLGLLEKMGVEYRSIQSSESKDALSAFRKVRPDERVFFQKQVMQIYDRFLGVILKSRNDRISEQKLRAVADGMVYNTEQALEHGLVDSSGYIEDAIEVVKRKSNFQRVEVVAYLPFGARNLNLYDVQHETKPLDLQAALQLLSGGASRRFYYLWEAGR